MYGSSWRSLCHYLTLDCRSCIPSSGFLSAGISAKTYILIASCTVLVVLLWETMMLYARLASATILQRRERAHRLMSVDAATAAIAHEISQPLGAIQLNCSTALDCLKTTPPDLEEVRACLTDTMKDSNRANKIIESVRGLFKTTAPQRTKIELNRLVGQVLRMVENDLHVHGVTVSTELQENLPEIIADPIQLQQVILNLIRNAIEAMAIGPATIKTLRLVTTKNGNSVVAFRPGLRTRNSPRKRNRRI